MRGTAHPVERAGTGAQPAGAAPLVGATPTGVAPTATRSLLVVPARRITPSGRWP
jgi:hypothetical protein